MIELHEKDLIQIEGHSSKGNQLKWHKDNVWYKADFTGYEGLSEYIISRLIAKSTLEPIEYALYSTVQIKYKHSVFNGAKSNNFLKDGWQIITLSRLYQTRFNRDFTKDIYSIQDVSERLEYFVNQVIKITGLKSFGKYINKILTIDALFLNEDRHLQNIGVLMGPNGEFDYCPIFDQGAGLLADTTLDYPLTVDVYTLIDDVHAKTICSDFNEALDASEKIYGENIHFTFTKKDVSKLLSEVTTYDDKIIKRVETIIYEQMRKYLYLIK